jgi:hypothetical protein
MALAAERAFARHTAAALTALSAAVALSCSRTTAQGPAPDAASPPPTALHALAASELSAAERKYGRAPQRDPSVTYGRDVIIVDGGADIIRSLSSDGLTWTLDPNAPHAKELEVGTIAFVTGRCVGRVLALNRDDQGLHLVLGPADLTEIFERLNVTFDQPIDLSQSVAYAARTLEGVHYPLAGDHAAQPEWSVSLPIKSPSAFHGDSDAGVAYRTVAAQPVSPGIPQRLNLKFYTTQLNTADGPVAELRHQGDNAVVIAQVQLRAPSPRLVFSISIVNRKVDASIILKNAVGLKLAFDAAASDGFYGNVNWYAPGPDLSIPIGGPVPFSITLKQGIWVKTAFSAQSSFSAGGDYDFNADLGVTFSNGTFDLVGPKGLTVRQSLFQNMGGVSISPRGIIISHQASVTAGVGAFGFTAGPRFDLGTSLGIAQGSNVAIVNCRGVTLAMNIRGGVGWTIPRIVTEIPNFFLRLIRAREIQDQGGVQSKWMQLFSQQTQMETAVCGGGGAG